MYVGYVQEMVRVGRWEARSLLINPFILFLFYCVDQKHYYYVRDDESFSFFDCYMGCSILLRRMGKCQERWSGSHCCRCLVRCCVSSLVKKICGVPKLIPAKATMKQQGRNKFWFCQKILIKSAGLLPFCGSLTDRVASGTTTASSVDCASRSLLMARE